MRRLIRKKPYLTQTEGRMVIYVELNDDILNSDKFWSKLRHGLDELKQQKLPSGVIALVGNNDFGDVSAMLITMSSEQKSFRQLEEIMKQLESEIRSIPSVSKIKRYGTQKEQIFVYLDHNKISEYNVNPTSIMASFRLQDLLNYAGVLNTGELELPIHLPSKYESEKDLEEQIVFSDYSGNNIRLKDVAQNKKGK